MTIEQQLAELGSAVRVTPSSAFGRDVRVTAGRRRRRRRAALGGGMAIVVASGVTATVAGTEAHGTRRARTGSIAAGLPTLAGMSPASGSVAPSDAALAEDRALAVARYYYIETVEDSVSPQGVSRDVIQTWFTRDGSPFRGTDNGRPLDLTGHNHVGEFEGRELSWNDLATLPTDPATLKTAMLDAAKSDTVDPPLNTALGDLAVLDSGLTPSAQRRALLATAESLGRVAPAPGPGVTVTSPDGLEQLRFDADDRAISEQFTATASATTLRTTTLAQGVVDSETQTLTAAPLPARLSQ